MHETKVENFPRCPRCAMKIRKARCLCPGCAGELTPEKLVTLPAARRTGSKTIMKGKKAVSLCALCLDSVPVEQIVEYDGKPMCSTCRDALAAKATKAHEPQPPAPPVV